MNLGSQIKAIRKKRGLTQKELADKLGVTASVISQYETGARNPKQSTIERLTSVLNCTYGIEAVISDNTQANIFLEESEEMTNIEQDLISFFRSLNDTGKAEALKRVQELTEIDRYKFK